MAMDVHSGGNQKKGHSRPEMNVTPLVDVVLVLLIIFMVVMPMLTESFWIHVPRKPDESTQQEEEESSDDEPPIVVTIQPDGRIRINQDTYTDAEFPVRLRRMLVAQGERKVYFDAHDAVGFARAVQVMDLARGGGAAHVAVMTESLQ